MFQTRQTERKAQTKLIYQPFMQKIFCIHWLKCRISCSQDKWIWRNYAWKTTNGHLLSKGLSTSYIHSTLHPCLTNILSCTESLLSLKFVYTLQSSVAGKIYFFSTYKFWIFEVVLRTVLIHQYQSCLLAWSRVPKSEPHLTHTQLFRLFSAVSI